LERSGLSTAQAQAIVEMTLGKLTGMERSKFEDELLRLHNLILELESILADENKIREIVKNEMSEIRRRYADERRTEIVAAEHEIILEDLIERHSCVITLTHAGYIKRLPADTYSAQNRGGKGIIGMSTKEEDFVENVMVVHSHSYLLMFTNMGRVYMKKAYMIPEASRTAKGTNIVNVIDLNENEKITSVISIAGFEEEEYFVMVTKNGIVKRVDVKDFEYQRKGGKIAIDLDEGDELVYVKHTKGDDEVVIATHDGRAVRFKESDARVMGRTARGVRGIKMNDGDYVVGVAIVDDKKKVITLTEKGYGKRNDFETYNARNRGTKGVICQKTSEKTGALAGIAAVGENDDIMIITNDGTIIRTPVSGIPV
jgi:DNA gyrase subunit A